MNWVQKIFHRHTWYMARRTVLFPLILVGAGFWLKETSGRIVLERCEGCEALRAYATDGNIRSVVDINILPDEWFADAGHTRLAEDKK